jgi:transposase-like protein
MARRKFTAEQIIGKLREAEVLQSQGESMEAICKQLEINNQTYYRWRKEYGGIRIDQAKKLKTLEQENARLKKIIADLTVDNSILKEVTRGNY